VHAGNPCPGPDGDNNCAESCNEQGAACNAADPNGSPCNDGLFCTATDTCQSGSCVGTGNPCPGPDGDSDCKESCDEASDSCSANDPNGSACDDGLFCNGADTCQNGTCSGHADNPCPGADGDANCSESCDENAKSCTAADPNGSACNDGVFCNGADTCSGGTCSVHAGNPCPGPDGDGDCKESCNEALANCTANDPNGSACNDGLSCTAGDNCQAGLCVAAQNNCGVCGDGHLDPGELCDDGNKIDNDCCSNLCIPAANSTPCNDGLFCNGADSCQAGACAQHAGNPCPGPDGDGNCAESCDETSDACTAADPNGSACDDGLFCDGTDTCKDGQCSQHAGNPCTGPDGDANCSESCNETADNCTGADPDGSACDDGLFCDGTDTCKNGQCSQHSGSPCAGPDGDADCAESCNELAHNCSASDPNGSACDDGVFCNGADTCKDGQCSQHAGNPCPGPDGDANCSESCNEAGDNCNGPDPDGSNCNDGLFCNGADTCSGGTCSQHAGNPCPGPDGDADCKESCNENAANCSANDPNGSTCNDGVECTTDDKCSNGICSGDASGCATTTTTLPQSLCGDANADGKITASDALAALKTAVGSTTCPLFRCDYNGDTKITASDALAILRKAVGQDVPPKCPPALQAEVTTTLAATTTTQPPTSTTLAGQTTTTKTSTTLAAHP
jgi:hypothetical protein